MRSESVHALQQAARPPPPTPATAPSGSGAAWSFAPWALCRVHSGRPNHRGGQLGPSRSPSARRAQHPRFAGPGTAHDGINASRNCSSEQRADTRVRKLPEQPGRPRPRPLPSNQQGRRVHARPWTHSRPMTEAQQASRRAQRRLAHAAVRVSGSK